MTHPSITRPGVAAGARTDAQLQRMQSAIRLAVQAGPAFLNGSTDADSMANTMVHAVQQYVTQEKAAGGDGTVHDKQAQALQEVLSELMGCGSGYLAGRCDAACVARTMTYMVNQFGDITSH